MLWNAAADAAAADARPRTAADEERARFIRDNFRRLRAHVILGTDAGAVGDFSAAPITWSWSSSCGSE